MHNNLFAFRFAVTLLIFSGISLSASGQTNANNSVPADLRGTWTGSFFSQHNNAAPFTMTILIAPDASGHLIGQSSMNSECMHGAQLHVSMSGAQVVLAGSNEDGDNLTLRFTLDATGTALKGTYILNGSATGKCETDNGTGNMAKR